MYSDGKHFYVEPTEIQAFVECRRKWSYRYKDQLVYDTPSAKLFLGSAVHFALGEYYKTWPDLDSNVLMTAYENYVIREQSRIRREITLTPEEDLELDKAREKGYQVLAAYPSWSKQKDLDSWEEVIMVEEPFEIDIPHEILNMEKYRTDNLNMKEQTLVLAGRPDMIVRDNWGRLWIVDHKTAQSYPDKQQLRLDLQMGSYTWAAHHLFENETIAGVWYNVLRKVNPSRARKSVFKRFEIPRRGKSLDRLHYFMIAVLEAMVKEYTEDYHLPSPGIHCGWKCSYTDVCVGEEDGSDVDELKNALYTVEEVPNYLKGGEE